MLIAFDAKWYFSGPPGGRSYVRGLIAALLRQREGTRWRFYLRGSDSAPVSAVPGSEGADWRPLGARFTPWRLRWAIPRDAAGEADVVVTHSWAAAPGPYRRVVIVYDILPKTHPALFSWSERRYFRGVERALDEADHLITISEHAAQEIHRVYGVRKERLSVAPPAPPWPSPTFIATDLITSLRQRLGLPPRYALALGRPNVRKNLQRLCRCVLAAIDDDDEARLALAGPLRARDLTRLRRALPPKQRHKLISLGWIGDDDLPALLAGATMLAYLPFAEGFGLPPLEAMSVGTPVLVSARSSLPEVVGDAGAQVDPEDERAIVEAAARLWHDHAFAARLGRAGRAQAARFSWEQSAAVVLAALRGVVENAR